VIPPWLHWIWSRPSRRATELLLWPLSVLEAAYGATMDLRARAYSRGWMRTEELPVPVISVGNLVVGGTGKTPLVIHLAERLRAKGYHPGILSRGYGGSNVKKGGHALLVSDGERVLASPAQAGDEPVLMAQRLPAVPVAVGARRVEAGRLLLKHCVVDVLLLDDGFQHLSLRRDADVVLVDAGVPFGNGHRLPRGPLRELPTALERADLLVVRLTGDAPDSGPPLLKDLSAQTSGAPLLVARTVVEGIHTADSTPLELAPGTPVTAFCGIGVPERFRATLEQMPEVRLLGMTALPDHANYTSARLADLAWRAGRAGAEAVLTTEKDWVKVAPVWPGPLPLAAVRIGLQLEPPVSPGGRAPRDGDAWLTFLMETARERYRRRSGSG